MKLERTIQLWHQLQQRTRVWRTAALPGLAVLGCVTIARFTGVFQSLEWTAFDAMLKSRPIEPPDSRIVIVGINERDIRAVGTYPIPDRTLAQLLSILRESKPRAIGLDIFRDLATERNRTEIRQAFLQTPNLVAIKTALGDDPEMMVAAPPELPPERVGFVDTLIDDDGKLRRSLLAVRIAGTVEYAFAVRLAEIYLRQDGLRLEYYPKQGEPRESIHIGKTALPRFQGNTGGYIHAEARGNQILINFRNHPQPFQVVSLSQVLRREIDPEIIRDRIVIIGTTAPSSVNDTFYTAAVKETIITNSIGSTNTYQAHPLYGVEHHAHVASQILSAALDQRALLRNWSEAWEYAWIVAIGSSGIAFGLFLQSPWKTLLGIGVVSLLVAGVGFGLLIAGWWIPVIPTLFALWGAGLTTALFDQRSRILLEQRERVLKRTYDAVHNGPLQRLAAMLRTLDDEPVSADWLRGQLQTLNQELRTVYESMQQGLQDDELFLQTPIAELLHTAYESTIQRDLPGFATIKLIIPPDFSALEQGLFTPEQKQGLCIFLQEALCNVGKHAVNPNRLEVECKIEERQYVIRIVDDGVCRGSENAPRMEGRGTSQARELARALHGKFQRRSRYPQGTICELIWYPRKRWFFF